MRDRIKLFIYILIVAGLTIIGIVLYEHHATEPIYKTCKVIKTNCPNNTIEVKLDEDGGRVFIDNFGNFDITDFSYGDGLLLLMEDRQFIVIDFVEEEE